MTEDGQFLQTNYTDYRAQTVFKYDIGGKQWSYASANQPSDGSQTTTGAFSWGSVGYNPVAQKAYSWSGSDWAGQQQIYPNGTFTVVGVPDKEDTWNKNLLTFDTDTFTWKNESTNTTDATKASELVFLPRTLGDKGGVAIELGGYTQSGVSPATSVYWRQLTDLLFA